MIGPPFFLVFLGRVRKEEEEEDMKEEELVEEGCLFRGTVFTLGKTFSTTIIINLQII